MSLKKVAENPECSDNFLDYFFAQKKKSLLEKGVDLSASSNLSDYLIGEEIEAIEYELEKHFSKIQDILFIDRDTDPNSTDTPRRIAKMYVREVFSGKYFPMPKMTCFPNNKDIDQLFTIGPISVKSCCSHHFVPFIGKVWIGVIPGKKLLGLSKYARLIKWIMARPHIQEDATKVIADKIEEIIEPQGLAIVMKAKHFCMCWRGVEENDSEMTSSIVRGLLQSPEARNEFFNLINVRER